MKISIAIFYTQYAFEIFSENFDIDGYELFLHERIISEVKCYRFSNKTIAERHVFYKDLKNLKNKYSLIDEFVFHNTTDFSFQQIYSMFAYDIVRWTCIPDGIGFLYYMPDSIWRLLAKMTLSLIYCGNVKLLPFNFLSSHNVNILENVWTTNYKNYKSIGSVDAESIIILGNTEMNYEYLTKDLALSLDSRVKYFVKHPLEKTNEFSDYISLSYEEFSDYIRVNKVLVITEISTSIFELLNNENVNICVARFKSNHVEYQMRMFDYKERVDCEKYSYYYL